MLRSPIPRTPAGVSTRFAYKLSLQTPLPVPPLLTRTFKDVVECRRSRRALGPLSACELSTVLWYSARRTYTDKSGDRLRQYSFPPTAGGLACIDIFVVDLAERVCNIKLYQPVSHTLALLDSLNGSYVQEIGAQLRQCFPATTGTALIFGAQILHLESYYIFAESLAWRDAGVLVAYSHLAAEAAGVGCCPFGPTFGNQLSLALDSGDAVVGMGGVLLGQAEYTEKTCLIGKLPS